MHDDAVLSVPVPVRDWNPLLPAGTLRTVVLHWTAGDYTTIFPAYHFCISGTSEVAVHTTHDLRANLRDVRADAAPYAAHTQGRNSYAAGIAVCAMSAATPENFAEHPLVPSQIDALCRVAAVIIRFYDLPVGAVMTHAEAALADGYFGSGDGCRWDMGRLRPASTPLEPAETIAVADSLRRRIARTV